MVLMVGHAYSYKCSHCGYEEYYKQGHGFLVRPQSYDEYIASNQKFFHYEIHNKIESLAVVHPALEIDATFRVFKCPKCNLLHGKVQVNLTEGEILLHASRFKCMRCRSRLRLTNIHRLKRATCPVCGKNSFHRQNLATLL